MEQILQLLGNNLIFSIPLMIVLVFIIFEIFTILAGFSIFEPINSFIDGIDIPGVELFTWFNKGEVPSTIFYGILFFTFGLIGLFITSIFYEPVNAILWYFKLIIALVSLLLSLVWTRSVSLLISKYIPQIQTSAFSKKSLIGCAGEVKDYKITNKQGGDVKVVSKDGKERFIFARAIDETELKKGDLALVVKVEKNNFYIKKI